MFAKLLRGIRAMELEDQIFHAAVLVCAISVFFPWFSKKPYDDVSQIFNGFGFYTGYMGKAVFAGQAYILISTIFPLLGGPQLMPSNQKRYIRLMTSATCCIILSAIFSVLLNVSFEEAGTDFRFGIYICFVASLVATMYAILRYRQERTTQEKEYFKHPDEQSKLEKVKDEPIMTNIPAPPPPPPLSAEDHPLYRQ